MHTHISDLLLKRAEGNLCEFWFLVSTRDGQEMVIHYSRCVLKNSHAKHKITGKPFNKTIITLLT